MPRSLRTATLVIEVKTAFLSWDENDVKQMSVGDD